jgi:hypothetical protein
MGDFTKNLDSFLHPAKGAWRQPLETRWAKVPEVPQTVAR